MPRPACSREGEPHALLGGQVGIDVGERALGVDERVAELDERVARDERRARPRRPARSADEASFSFSSSTTRCAVLRPMPGIASKRAVSSSAIARRSSAGRDPDTIASATFGPTPETDEQVLEQLALLAVGEPVELERVLANVEVGLDRDLARRRPPPERRRRRLHEVADAADVEHEAVGAAADRDAAEPPDHDATRWSGDASAWQIATASASAA